MIGPRVPESSNKSHYTHTRHNFTQLLPSHMKIAKNDDNSCITGKNLNLSHSHAASPWLRYNIKLCAILNKVYWVERSSSLSVATHSAAHTTRARWLLSFFCCCWKVEERKESNWKSFCENYLVFLIMLILNWSSVGSLYLISLLINVIVSLYLFHTKK